MFVCMLCFCIIVCRGSGGACVWLCVYACLGSGDACGGSGDRVCVCVCGCVFMCAWLVVVCA